MELIEEPPPVLDEVAKSWVHDGSQDGSTVHQGPASLVLGHISGLIVGVNPFAAEPAGIELLAAVAALEDEVEISVPLAESDLHQLPWCPYNTRHGRSLGSPVLFQPSQVEYPREAVGRHDLVVVFYYRDPVPPSFSVSAAHRKVGPRKSGLHRQFLEEVEGDCLDVIS